MSWITTEDRYLDVYTLEVQDLRPISEEVCAVSQDLVGNDFEVSGALGSQVTQELFQTFNKPFAFLSSKFVGISEGSQNLIICEHLGQLSELILKYQDLAAVDIVLFSLQRTGKPHVSEVLKLACLIIAYPTS